jgi:hypothetical protein
MGAAAALRGKAGRLVEHDRRAVLGQDDAFGERHFLFGQRLARRGPPRRGLGAAGRNAQGLAGDETGVDIGALAVDAICPVRAQRETVAKPTCGK